MSGVVQNQDSYMKGKIAQRWYYDRVRPALKAVDATSSTRQTGRKYDFVMPYRCEDAEYIIVGMGCIMETAEATVDYLREKGHQGRRAARVLLPAVPRGGNRRALRHCKAFTVFERMDNPLMQSNPQLCEIKAAFCDAMTGRTGTGNRRACRGSSAAAGLGSRDVRAGDIIAVVDNMSSDGPDFFCVGIDHAPALHDRPRTRTCAPGRVLDARPLGRRLRLGDDQQGHRHHRRRRVRQGRAGLPQVRLREEGPADDVLPDHRRQHIYMHCELEHVEFVASTTRPRSAWRIR